MLASEFPQLALTLVSFLMFSAPSVKKAVNLVPSFPQLPQKRPVGILG